MPTNSFDSHNTCRMIAAHANDTTRKNPVEKVSGQYGALMGRTGFGTAPAAGVRLAKVAINSGGYDTGGVYWGIGRQMWAAVDNRIPCQFCRYTRADTRAEAMIELELTSAQLLRK